MNPVLFYPHYMPDKRWLRLMLLFYDQVRTIVPDEDQAKIFNLDYVEELHGENDNLIELISVTDDLYEKAINDETRGKVIDLVDQIRAGGDAQEPTDFNLTIENIRRLKDQERWVYVSAGKLGELIDFHLRESGVAIEIPAGLRDQLQDQSIFSEAPVLTHPKVAEFVISRLASTAADEGRSACVTNKPGAYAFNAVRTGFTAPEDMVETHLISETLDLIVPDDLELIEVNKFQDIRNGFKGYRDAVHQMMRFKLHNAGPFDPDQFENYCKQIRELAESIKGNALDVEKQIRTARRSEWKRTTIRNVLSIVGAGAGGSAGADDVGAEAERAAAGEERLGVSAHGDRDLTGGGVGHGNVVDEVAGVEAGE